MHSVAETHALTQALTLAALLAGTIQYGLLMQHRERAGSLARERQAAADVGLRGLVRVFLAEPDHAPGDDPSA